MKIDDSNLSGLHNEEHYQFHAQFLNSVKAYGPEILKIEEPFNNSYIPGFQKEDESIKFVRKSPFTERLMAMDGERDRIATGLVLVIRANFYHPDPEVVKAAKRLKILTDVYGKISDKSYSKETAAITNLVQDLNGAYATDASMVCLENWVVGLDSCNQQFQGLENERYYELMERTDLRMEIVREEIDLIYYSIIERINALMVIEGEGAYARFAEEHNLHIEYYKNIIAQRRGRAAARKENEDEEPIINDEL